MAYLTPFFVENSRQIQPVIFWRGFRQGQAFYDLAKILRVLPKFTLLKFLHQGQACCTIVSQGPAHSVGSHLWDDCHRHPVVGLHGLLQQNFDMIRKNFEVNLTIKRDNLFDPVLYGSRN